MSKRSHKTWQSVPRLWAGSSAVCIASGPSLDIGDLQLLRQHTGRVRVIVVNRMWQAAPWADILYAADKAWWDSQEAPSDDFAGLRVSASIAEKADVRVGVRNNYTLDPRWLCSGTNSGLQALCLAANLGAKRIALLGYTAGYGVTGELHSHPDHIDMNNPGKTEFSRWIAAFGAFSGSLKAAGIDVVNCSQSALTCFRRLSLHEFLA